MVATFLASSFSSGVSEANVNDEFKFIYDIMNISLTYITLLS